MARGRDKGVRVVREAAGPRLSESSDDPPLYLSVDSLRKCILSAGGKRRRGLDQASLDLGKPE